MNRVMLEAIISGDPMPAPRAGRNGHQSFKPARYVAAMEALQWSMKSEMAEDRSAFPLDVPVSVTLRFYRGSWRTVDLDNLEKTVMDAMTGLVFRDDALVHAMHSRKILGDENPRTEISVALL